MSTMTAKAIPRKLPANLNLLLGHTRLALVRGREEGVSVYLAGSNRVCHLSLIIGLEDRLR